MTDGYFKDNNSLRVVFMTYPALYPLIMLNYWLKKPKVHSVVAILLSDFDFKEKGKPLPFFKVVLRVIKHSGLRYALYELIFTHLLPATINIWNIFRLASGKKKKLFTFRELAYKYAIPIYKSSDFNDRKTIRFLNNVNATLIVSAFNNQIIKRNIIKFPKFGAVNIHPSFLPDFRGADPAFSSLFHGVKETGVTIHFMDGKIDSGPIIAQEKLRIKLNHSLFSLNVRLWMHGAKMLPKVLKQIIEGDLAVQKQNSRLIKYRYSSFPTRKKVKALLRRKVPLITLRDIRNTFKT